MNKKLISLAVAGAVAAPLTVQAGSLSVANQDITLSGGLTGAYFYNSDTTRDAFTVPDALIDLSSAAKTGGIGFDVGVGTLTGNSLATSGGPLASGAGTTSVQYGWVSILPMKDLEVDAGKLATNVGYEVVPSYSDANILRGLVWNAQPAYYNGARVTYSMKDLSFYAELNKAGAGNGPGSAVGASASFGKVNGSVSYFNIVNSKSIFDIIASSKLGSTTIAANFDYQSKAKAAKTAGTDDNAYGLAIYALVPMGDKITLPARLEYVSDGSSGLYGLGSAGNSNSAISLTVTPTYNFSDSTFVRAELALVATDNKTAAYQDDKGVNTDSNLFLGLQGGILF